MANTLSGSTVKDENLKGHGTDALGPSDSSDSASDTAGGPGLIEGDVIGSARHSNCYTVVCNFQ